MKTILACVLVTMVLFSLNVQAQETKTSKKNKREQVNSKKPATTKQQKPSGSNPTLPQTDKQNDNSGKLLGDDNRKAKSKEGKTSESDYRNNKVSGNPNNRTMEEKSRKPTSNVTSTTGVAKDQSQNQQQNAQDVNMGNTEGEGATGTESAGNIKTGQSDTNPRASISPSVEQTTTSDSGSPAVLAENNGRDGTNTRQRATYNMAGSPVSGSMNLDKKQVDKNPGNAYGKNAPDQNKSVTGNRKKISPSLKQGSGKDEGKKKSNKRGRG